MWWHHRGTRRLSPYRCDGNIRLDHISGRVATTKRQRRLIDRGYVLDVYGPDATRPRTYDTTPENNP
jgi:hypothetical protein